MALMSPVTTQAALPTPCLMLPLLSFPFSSTAPHQTPPSWQPRDVREPWRMAGSCRAELPVCMCINFLCICYLTRGEREEQA